MNIDINDPKLTAYALDELDDAECGDVERLLADSPVARAEVEAIRTAAAALTRELAAEPVPGDNGKQQTAEVYLIAAKIRRWVPVALAASLFLAVGTMLWRQPVSQLGDATPSSEATRVVQMVPADEPAESPETAIAALPSQATSRGDRKVQGGGAVQGEGNELWAKVQENNTTPMQFTAPSPASEQAGDTSADLLAMDLRPATVAQAPSRTGGLGGGWDLSRGTGLKDDEASLSYANQNQSSGRVDTYMVPGGEIHVPKNRGRAIELEQTGRDADRDDWWNFPRDGQRPIHEQAGEAYDALVDNPFLPALQNPLSTFSIDVDTASYSNIRRMLNASRLPPAAAVRIEEMINYFAFDYPQPDGEHPFSVNLETAECPWAREHQLVRIALAGREVKPEKRPACNLVFLIDVSGSMSPANRLPLVKQGLAVLVNQLTAEDRVAIVVYAGETGMALPSTPASDKQTILDALDRLKAGGSTNGGEGIQLAYATATQHFIQGGVNRVILCTDGDFNVGITDRNELVKLVEKQAQSGVFLSVLGFGMDNLKDATLEQLSNKGNGHYAYIDTFAEAKKVLIDEQSGTLITIAKDVKIQIEFNPAQVAAYRLIGYENRILAARDFNDDKKDAGEIGAGHRVTALYEIVPAHARLAGVDPLKYQTADQPADAAERPHSNELLTVKLRYKQPEGDVSTLIEVPMAAGEAVSSFEGASIDTRFAASVAGFGMLLRDSPHKGELTYETVINMAVSAMGRDASGQRAEFVDLVRKAQTLSGRR